MRYNAITAMVRDFPQQVGIAYTPQDMRRLHGEGKFAVFLSMLNAYALGDDVDQLDRWAARGVRMFGFSYVGNNSWADSSRPLPFFNDTADALDGLSPVGKRAVQRLNDLGVIIDVSQMSSKALAQAVALSRAPVVASHSAPRAMVDIKRNLSDKELQLIKDSGGVVQLVAFSTYLKPLSSKTQDKLNALRARYDLPPLANLDYALMPGDPVIAGWPEQKVGQYANALYGILEEEPPATLKDYGDAIDYTVRKVGIDHVGLSSDFNEGGGIDGWQNASEARNVTAELISRGYSEADIAKLWGGNFLRVWEQVQRAAQPVATSSPDPCEPFDERSSHLSQTGRPACGRPAPHRPTAACRPSGVCAACHRQRLGRVSQPVRAGPGLRALCQLPDHLAPTARARSHRGAACPLRPPPGPHGRLGQPVGMEARSRRA